MIRFTTGNIFDSSADALVNTVNTEGVMGKGIALQFKKQFPSNYKVYREACKQNRFHIGDLLFFEEENLVEGRKWIINFPTKTTWRQPSQYSYIEKGLEELKKTIPLYPIRSIALPPLGSGNGGLDWNRVKELIKVHLMDVDLDITVFEPNAAIHEKMKTERVKLTEARAMLLFMLFQLVKNGEFVSEFSSEKICYFLQRFGAKKHLKLQFEPQFYGPYSGLVKRVLNHLNGSYIMGYGGMDKKPFEEMTLVPDGEAEVLKYLEERQDLKEIVKKTDEFLSGFYSDFGLELLSTIDFIMLSKKTVDKDSVKEYLHSWSDRKRTLFSNEKFIDISISHLREANFSENTPHEQH